MLQFFGFKFGNCHDVVLLRLLLIRRCKQKCLKISYLTQICQVLGRQISRSPPDKCRSIVKKAGEAISQTHFPQFFLHFYSDQNRRQTLGLLYFGNFKISIMHFVPQIQYILYSPKLGMYSKLRYIFICE